jgi:hypothetical protein
MSFDLRSLISRREGRKAGWGRSKWMALHGHLDEVTQETHPALSCLALCTRPGPRAGCAPSGAAAEKSRCMFSVLVASWVVAGCHLPLVATPWPWQPWPWLLHIQARLPTTDRLVVACCICFGSRRRRAAGHNLVVDQLRDHTGNRGVGSYTRSLVYGVGHGKPGKSGGLW